MKTAVLVHGMIHNFEEKKQLYDFKFKNFDVYHYAPDYLVDSNHKDRYFKAEKIDGIKYYSSDELMDLARFYFDEFNYIYHLGESREEQKLYDIQMRLNDIIFQSEFLNVAKDYEKVICISSSWNQISNVYSVNNVWKDDDLFSENNWYVYDKSIDGANSIWTTDVENYENILNFFRKNMYSMIRYKVLENKENYEVVLDSQTKKGKVQTVYDCDVEKIRRDVFDKFYLNPVVCACTKSKFRVSDD